MQVTGHRSQVTGHRSQVTGHRSRVKREWAIERWPILLWMRSDEGHILGRMRDYRKLAVFPKAHALALRAHRETQALPRSEQWELGKQMRSSSRSIPTNLVEGCGRWTNADFAHFVDMSIGSANEFRYYCEYGRDLGFLSADVARELYEQATEVIRMLLALARAARVLPKTPDDYRDRADPVPDDAQPPRRRGRKQ